MCSCPHVRRKVRCFAQRTAKTKDQKKETNKKDCFPFRCNSALLLVIHYFSTSFIFYFSFSVNYATIA